MNVKELGLELFVVCVLGNFLSVFYKFFLGKNFREIILLLFYLFLLSGVELYSLRIGFLYYM